MSAAWGTTCPGRGEVYQLPDVDVVPEVETGKSFRRFCLIDEGGVHVGTHAFHAELFQVDGLVADVHSSADIVECDFLVKDFPEIGLQFKIQVLGDDEQLYFGGDRIAFRSQRIRRERY